MNSFNLDMTSLLFPLMQHGARWARASLGFSKLTIGDYGSLLTCMAMIAGTTPTLMNRLRKQFGAFDVPEVGSGKMLTFDIEQEACMASGRGVGLTYVSGLYPHVAFPSNDVDALLNHIEQPGGVAILETDVVPEGSKADTHFVLAHGPVGEDGGVWILDPWDGKQKSLMPEYGCRLNRVINRMILYKVVPNGDNTRPTDFADRDPLPAGYVGNRFERE